MSRFAISVDDVYADIGVVEHDHAGETRLKPQRPWEKVANYGLMFYWPKSESWLTVEILAYPSSSAPPVMFASNREVLEHIARQHGVDANKIAPLNFTNAANIRVGSISQTCTVTIRLQIDTTAESFKTAVERSFANGTKELVQRLSYRIFDARSLNALCEQAGEISLNIRPGTPVPRFAGVVAIDLGNTSSDLACISRKDPVYKTSSIKLLDSEPVRPRLSDQSKALKSDLRVDRLVSTEPVVGTRRFPDPLRLGDDAPNAVTYVVGPLAVGQSVTPLPGLILGAKRLVSGQSSEGFRRLKVQHQRGHDEPEFEEEIEVQNRVAAELLACRMLEQFRAAANAWPGELILTYPTTYTPRELHRLKQAVERGWLRMLGQSQRLGGSPPPEDPELRGLINDTQASLIDAQPSRESVGLIREQLDEATAAAFYFLFREIFESPGGLSRFRYLYPRGMNALLYDCGGGTTDIALVRAYSAPNKPTDLSIKVLKRTGLRDFGGDNMTHVIARLLKAQILAAVLTARGKTPPRIPSTGLTDSIVNQILDLDPNDQLVPTKFDRLRFDDQSLARRRNALELWRWAEQLKIDLSAEPPTGKVKFGGILTGRDALAKPIYEGLSSAQARSLETQLKALELTRKTVDQFLDTAPGGEKGPITRSIEKCNRLMQAVLRDGRTPPEEVDRVIISGNAAKYPLIREKMKELLMVDDFEERLRYDEANLKHAVAKGAVLFLTTKRASGLQATITTEENLNELLPFDVGYFDLAKGRHIILFEEHEKYDELAEKEVKVEAAGATDNRRSFTLERRFPGDDDFSQFLRFDFAEDIRGPLRVKYNRETFDFEVTDSATNFIGQLVDLTDTGVYIAPPERGDV